MTHAVKGHLMELIGLNCQHCSAPLQVPADAKFVTCTHCGTQLAVRKTGSAAYTEMLDAIDERTERMAEQLKDLQRRSEVAELDRQWQLDREQYYETDKHGHRHLPTEGSSIVGGIVVIVIGVVWTVIASNFNGLLGLFGIAFVAFGIWNAINGYHKADAYKKAESRYRRRRVELLQPDDAELDHPM